MPLSKAKNRQRMRLIRLHKAISTPQDIKPVQPKPIIKVDLDADGQPIPGYI